MILRENPNLPEEAKDKLRELRTDIYDGLDGETSVRISIYVMDENDDRPFEFIIGSGGRHLIVNILKDKVKYRFTTGRFWTRFCKGVANLFRSLFASTVGKLTNVDKKDQIENAS